MARANEESQQKSNISGNDEDQNIEKSDNKSALEKFFSFIRELVILVLIAFVLAFVFKTFIFQPFKVEMSSMVPTVMPKDRVLVNKFVYRFGKPQRGDIVTVYSPEKTKDTGFEISHLFVSPRKILIKRVIATDGETIEIRNGIVFINNKKINEKYTNNTLDIAGFGPIVVPKNSVFLMGDNRPNSKDSRSFGALKTSEILGKASVTYWPLKDFKLLKNN